MSFESRYHKLNESQRTAVDTIDGPVMVVAGPGTGKTELLSMRIANILRQTDTLPENILCLTFTESGARAMRERLASIIGAQAHKVAIHTFHSFGSEIINRYNEYFYQGALFRPADDISRHELLVGIFDELSHDSPLAARMNGEYTYLREATRAIGELKKSGLTSDELLAILDENDETIDAVEKLLASLMLERVSKASADKLQPYLEQIRALRVTSSIDDIVPLADIIADSLEHALTQVGETNSTKPITAWKAAFWRKNTSGAFELKSRERQKKLRAVAYIYGQYLLRMQEAELYDYDDMILRVVHALEVFDDLRMNLQEQYQYILVDEFQDTNMAQMRILHNLTLNTPFEDTANIMVVGDDDQAIYSFQGADISNILSFTQNYPKAKLITLTDNYRSAAPILAAARSVITQGETRLETQLADLDKTLTPHVTKDGGLVLNAYTSQVEELHAIAQGIKQQIVEEGIAPSDIAVLARKHAGIELLLPYLAQLDIPVSYERRENILELESIHVITQLAELILSIRHVQPNTQDVLLAEILPHPAFGFSAESIWRLSIEAYRQRTSWLSCMHETEEFKSLAEWLVQQSFGSQTLSLEEQLDILIGSAEPVEGYRSPLYAYYFNAHALESQTSDYIIHLQALRKIRTVIREYRPGSKLLLEDFVGLIRKYKELNQGITFSYEIGDGAHAVRLMSAHGSKGLEFPVVYVLDSTETTWGARARSAPRMISYPENLPLAPAGDTLDDKLRLYYVALTRAKYELILSYAQKNTYDRPTDRLGFIESLDEQRIDLHESADEIAREQETMSWHDHIVPTHESKLADVLASTLASYQLSITHLQNFLDVTRGGPRYFLMQNLLRFPQAMSPAASYGSSIHYALQKAHAHILATKKRQAPEDVLANFAEHLTQQRLSQTEYDRYLQKGRDELLKFLDRMYESFSAAQKPEINFRHEGVIIGGARLGGALDVLEQHNKSIRVIDYKTGKPTSSWHGKTDYEKIKLHKYQMQLDFYKLLVENARSYSGCTVTSGELQYIQPTLQGDIAILTHTYESSDLERLKSLIGIVWQKIQTLDFPDTSNYEPSLKGIKAFEDDLLSGDI